MNPWMWKRIFSQNTDAKTFKLGSEKIEIFSRHCRFSSISAHKKRFSSFSREKCVKNLIDTIDLSKVNLTFWYDVSGSEAHFLDEETRFPVVKINAGSEASSFLQLLEYVKAKNFAPDTILYFVEDDYIHKPGWIEILKEGLSIPNVDYVTLYDHKDKYFLPIYKTLESKIYVTESSHWRTVPSTTQTFGARWEVLERDMAFHKLFSKGRKISEDHKKFSLLTRLGRTLISSIPGFSTHAEPEFASPLTDWEALLEEKKECVL